ncbi:MAG TPA: hypothetical protein VHA56_12630 [Mucilaginibacter sp.]|nr:hypothetical protein [Mucilaginibacter sp.]
MNKPINIAVIKSGWLRVSVLCTILVLLMDTGKCFSQSQSVVTNLSAIDGLELNPDNIFNYQMINNTGSTKDVTVKGSVIYRSSGISARYSCQVTLQNGFNQISKEKVHNLSWEFSSQAFRELFFTYRKMPQGTYEYCVNVSLTTPHTESVMDDPQAECIYQTVNDLFLINLVDPEDDAKIYEHNPDLSWIVNFPFANELTYRVRVAELKAGQNKENAIVRNNPVYQDDRVTMTNIIYPVTAKPLKVFQPYVWTVDAFYKGILLGGAEPWQFTIIEDSLENRPPGKQPYVDIRVTNGSTQVIAIGSLNVKYTLREQSDDSLTVKVRYLTGAKDIDMKEQKLKVNYGDNFYVFDFYKNNPLKHNGYYLLTLTNQAGKIYRLPFKYLNPDFIK